MKILHQNNIGFAISDNGEITCSSIWEVMADSIDDWTGLEASVKSWAGNIGEGWRVPTATSDDFTVDTERVIIGIEFNAKSRWVYEVSFKGRKVDVTERMIDYSESINNRDERQKTAKWSIAADSLDDFLPKIGDVLDWAGQFFYCDSINSQKVGILEGRYEVEIVAIDLSTVMLGNPSFSRNEKYESVKSATWKVSNDAYEAFIEAHDVNSDASSWAGADYYVTSIKAEPRGKVGYDVTVEAKHVGVRCIEVKREEGFKAFDDNGGVVREIKYTGRWQVFKDNLDEFKNITGDSAAAWAEDGYIITRVSPSQISDVEYEYNLEASDPANYNSNSNPDSMLDDRSKLSNRIDVNPGMREFILTEKQCGWIKEKPFKKGSSTELIDKDLPEIWKPIVKTAMYQLVDDEYKEMVWKASRDCPFVIPGNNDNNYIDFKYANKPFQCVCIEYTKYTKGDPSRQLGQLQSRINSMGEMIGRQKINGLEASWKRSGYSFEKILDNKGMPWWKQSFTLIAAPNKWDWSKDYHEGQG